MSKIKQLELYTKASVAIVEFKKKNAKVFEQYDSLLVEASKSESALKQYVRDEVKGNISNEFVKVTYAPAFSKYYDPQIVLEMATPKLRKELMAGGAIVIEQKVDTEKFTKLVESGIVPVEIKQKAFKEKELSPRVIIKENK